MRLGGGVGMAGGTGGAVLWIVKCGFCVADFRGRKFIYDSENVRRMLF